MAKKWYVVWRGRGTGVFDDWDTCAAQVQGFAGARYKSFPTRAEAEAAFRGRYENYVTKKADKPAPRPVVKAADGKGPLAEAVAVDAACSGVPGPVEYRGVDLATGEEFFREGPFPDGTNNVGEFLAIVHALQLLARDGRTVALYSDSRNALGWVKAGKCRTQMEKTARNAELFRRIAAAEEWLAANAYPNRLLKWETEQWGENPADFGRK
jgi:ribonuclease HI